MKIVVTVYEDKNKEVFRKLNVNPETESAMAETLENVVAFLSDTYEEIKDEEV